MSLRVLMRAAGWIAGVALALWPGPGALYDMLAAPLVASLPHGATMIATNVISPFLVPLKITMMAAFLLALLGYLQLVTFAVVTSTVTEI